MLNEPSAYEYTILYDNSFLIAIHEYHCRYRATTKTPISKIEHRRLGWTVQPCEEKQCPRSVNDPFARVCIWFRDEFRSRDDLSVTWFFERRKTGKKKKNLFVPGYLSISIESKLVPDDRREHGKKYWIALTTAYPDRRCAILMFLVKREVLISWYVGIYAVRCKRMFLDN